MNNPDKEAGQPPRVWILNGRKAGDNTQLRALAEALGWPFEIRRIRNRPWELLTNRLLGVTLAGVDRKRSDRLAPPWPDLLLTAGRRNEPVARWVRRQSGGKTRLVHVGRPWAPLECFDLIVTTPQYELPARPNVLVVDLPLHGLTRQALDREAEAMRAAFDDLPTPRWSVLLGGDSGPFVFTPAKARRLARWLNRRVAAESGSVLATDSARTPTEAYRTFLNTLEVPVRAWHWGGQGENPYRAYLALADRIVVTGESMSMLAEASAARRPLYIFDLSDAAAGVRRPWWTIAHNFRYKPFTHRLAMRLAPRRMRRDVSRIQEWLVRDGVAAWAGQDVVAPAAPPVGKGVEAAAEAVRRLFASERVSPA